MGWIRFCHGVSISNGILVGMSVSGCHGEQCEEVVIGDDESNCRKALNMLTSTVKYCRPTLFAPSGGRIREHEVSSDRSGDKEEWMDKVFAGF